MKLTKSNLKRIIREELQVLAEQQIDLFVLDEIHFSKNEKSTRFKNMGWLLSEARKKNPNLKVLAMTATPIVNDLAEGKTQLQLITGKKYDELKTTPYTDNAIALWEKSPSFPKGTSLNKKNLI